MHRQKEGREKEEQKQGGKRGGEEERKLVGWMDG